MDRPPVKTGQQIFSEFWWSPQLAAVSIMPPPCPPLSPRRAPPVVVPPPAPPLNKNPAIIFLGRYPYPGVVHSHIMLDFITIIMYSMLVTPKYTFFPPGGWYPSQPGVVVDSHSVLRATYLATCPQVGPPGGQRPGSRVVRDAHAVPRAPHGQHQGLRRHQPALHPAAQVVAQVAAAGPSRAVPRRSVHDAQQPSAA